MKYSDGILVLHQSDISHFITCPEQFRVVNHLGQNRFPEPDDGPIRSESDAATIGTCLHALIENELQGGWFKTLQSAKKWARTWFGQQIVSYLEDEVEYRTESYGGDPTKTLRAVDQLVESWWHSTERAYWQQRDRDTFLVEQYFDVPFVTRTGDGQISQIRLAGTPDIVDLQENRLVDWKSASRRYQRWEKQRWAHQPTTYTFAAAQQGWIEPNGDGLYRFDYRVFERGKVDESQELTVWRGSGQWAWLTQLVNNMADMMESDAATWPLRDDHALCGPKWCPIWYDCKGQFVSDDWA